MSDVSDREAEDTMDEDSSGYGYDDEMAESGFTDGEENQIEDELDFDDDDINFQSQELKPKSKSYQVDFKVHSVESIVNKQKEEIEHVSAFLQLKETDAAILLRHYGWNKERLIELWVETPEKLKLEAGITDVEQSPKLQALANFTCEVCYLSSSDIGDGKEKNPKINTLALACGHRFCQDCYTMYIEGKIKEGESRKLQCMKENCGLVVDEKTVGILVGNDLLEKYVTLLNKCYVADSGIMRWCPAPNCEHAVECGISTRKLDTVVPSVQCTCGEQFCYGCGNSAHQPAICKTAVRWLKKCEDDSETANWISANTKECPNEKCKNTIEKNGGCNHVSCRSCRHEFCWICMGPWSEHGNAWYNCNRYDEKSGQDARTEQQKSRAQLERYLHYFNRYANHEQSAKLERDLYLRTEKKMEQMQLTSDLTWIEVQFMRKAIDVLGDCRMTLKWTYCMAFYLEKNNMTELFEDNQRDLERAVEELSGELEKPIDPQTIPLLRQKVTDLTVYVSRRREIVLSDTAEGFEEGRWKWNDMLNESSSK